MASTISKALVILIEEYGVTESALMERNLASTQYTDPVSHDGIHDALTHLASPALFYEVAYIELARSDREMSPLTIFQFNLALNPREETSSEYEIAMINFAKAMRQISRQSDLSARVGRFVFFALIHIPESGAPGYIARLQDIWKSERYLLTSKFVTREIGETLLPLLNRLDIAESIN